jgi:hypothetical protein
LGCLSILLLNLFGLLNISFVFKHSLTLIVIISLTGIRIFPLITTMFFVLIGFGRLPIKRCFAVIVGGTVDQWNLEHAFSNSNYVREFLYLGDID